MRRFKFIRDPLATDVGDNVEEFLRELDGPACFFLSGQDETRTLSLIHI